MLNEVKFNDDYDEDDDDDEGDDNNNNHRDRINDGAMTTKTTAKGSKPLEKKKGEINLEQLVRLFINHRLLTLASKG